MIGPAKLDGRRAKLLADELRRRAEAVLGDDGRSIDAGPVVESILAVAARIGEEVTSRLDKVPAKQEDNFYKAAGIGRDPARPAGLPVAFTLVDGNAAISAPAATQLMATADGPVVFETEHRIDLVPGRVAALRGLDADGDAISMPSDTVIAAGLPHAPTIVRRLRGGAGAGATQVQIDPAAGLEPGALLTIGEGGLAREYRAVAVEGDLVTLAPPLEAALERHAMVREVIDFAPFVETTRNHQTHALYLGHATLLDLPSPATIHIGGDAVPTDAEWSWWGKLGENDDPDWQALAPALPFEKGDGKPVKKKINGIESLWLRARLPGESAGSRQLRNLTLAVGGSLCGKDRDELCAKQTSLLNVGFEAIANNVPVVPNSPFHPFGREPRLYDAFHIGSDEAFAKVGAEVSLCFSLAGAELGPLAGQAESDATRLFGVGSDGILYRLQLTPTRDAQNRIIRTAAQLQTIRAPAGETGNIALKPRSPLAFWADGSTRLIAAAAADDNAVFVAEIPDGGEPPRVKWHRLPLPTGSKADELAIRGTGRDARLYVRAGKGLYVWDRIADNAQPSNPRNNVRDLLAVQDSGAVLIVEHVGSDQLRLIRELPGGGATEDSIAATELPLPGLSAIAGSQTRLFIAGYDASELRLIEVEDDPNGGFAFKTHDTGQPAGTRLPVALSPGQAMGVAALTGVPGAAFPILTLATSNPTHISWVEEQGSPKAVISSEPVSIGPSANPARCFHRTTDYVVVQRPDIGVYFRRAVGSRVFEEISAQGGPALIVDDPGVLRAAYRIAYFDGAQGRMLEMPHPAPGDGSQILTMVDPADPLPDDTEEIVALGTGTRAGSVMPGPAGTVQLAGTADATGQLLQMDVEIVMAGQFEVWRLTRQTAATNAWDDPGLMTGSPRTFRELRRLGTVTRRQRGRLFADASPVATAVARGDQVWRAGNADFSASEAIDFGTSIALAYPDGALHNGVALFMAAPPSWDSAGPDRAANPTLSWEYWNGESWWALAKDALDKSQLDDRTFNFTVSGGVFFKAPADIAPTDVGGKKIHWIRARLTGGDYGEAEVKEVSNGIFKRDISTIRAPLISQLKLGYCARTPVHPEHVLTEDSLGFIDQTSANVAGLEFPVFTPIAELMNPPDFAETVADVAAAADRCDDPCPETDADKPSPCDAPGAYDSCDSACVAPPGYRRPAAGAAPGFVRGLMVGFDRPFSGDTIALYADAEPSGTPAELIAEILYGGRYLPVQVADDTSNGLTEPGILTLALPEPPDLSDMLGTSAHWLRLRPKRDPGQWSPRLRGLYLNAVLARSVETRAMERLGASIAVENQDFRLAEGPVLPDSLVLRVREALAEEEVAEGGFDIVSPPASPPGAWVRWQVSEDLTEEDGTARRFLFDADEGTIRFGDGKAGMIPPLGADVMAFCYRKVVGSKANGVAPGAKIQLLSPLAGVERAIALDHAAGGADVEALDAARRRAPAKIRHGRRIVTRADLEDHALTLSPWIAQVRAEARRGRTRLIVVIKGPEPRPLPAQLRGFADQIREVAAFGLAREDGLEVVAPRLLPLAVRLTLLPRTPAAFAEAAALATEALIALFDPATGYHDGRGWPLGRLPDDRDIAAALVPVEPFALPVEAVIERADREVRAERVLPATIPSDVLVRLDKADIAFERAREEAA